MLLCRLHCRVLFFNKNFIVFQIYKLILLLLIDEITKMHGRLKIKTTAEQQEAKRIEREKKLKLYQAGTQKLFAKRKNQELDEEALTLSKEFLIQNPDFYTLWNFRKEILLHMQNQKTENEFCSLISQELELTQSCLCVNPKSYGVWHHRSWAMENIPKKDWDHELKLCNLLFTTDDRNFHCWDYRRFICNAMGIQPESELECTSKLIKENFSNYSAWHYRSKLLPLLYPGNNTISINDEKKLDEFDLVQNAAFTDPDDQSVWFYHRWLLGRGSSDLELLSLGISKESGILTIHLSSPIELNQTCQLDLTINGKATDVIWKSALNSYASSVWYCNLAREVFSSKNECSVTFSFNGTADVLSSSTEQHCAWKYENFSNLFCLEINAATKDVLLRELDSCHQLLELEPENKWTLFTSVTLMKAIDSQKYNTFILDSLEKLITLDSMRANYYRDLRSKFLVENFIETIDTFCWDVELTNCKLSSLHHCEFLNNMKKIDFSRNNLTSVQPLRYCVSAEEIILDDNNISSCEGLENHPSLKKFSLKNNHILRFEDLEPLTKCKRLQQLFLAGNSIDKNVEEKLKAEDKFSEILLDFDNL